MSNPNHPQKGSSIKVEPIRQKAAIERLKAALLHGNKHRDYCLFVLGINTALRANELLSLRVDQVLTLQAGDRLEVKQSKNRKYRAITLNRNASHALRQYIENDKELQRRMSDRRAPLFYSRRGDVLTVQAVHAMVKGWCAGAGLRGNYGSHTLRKTWGYWQYQSGNARTMPLLMEAFGHSSQKQTLDYLCIQAKDIEEIYTGLEL
jgi:integrase